VTNAKKARVYSIPSSILERPRFNPPKSLNFDPKRLDESGRWPRGYTKDVDGVLVPTRGQTFRSVVLDNLTGKSVFDASYTIDQFGRRRTTENRPRGGYLGHLLLLGCSNTYGEGVSDSETLASVIAHKAPRVNTYNLGFPGYSPAALLSRIRTDGFLEGINEQMGQMIYVFIDNHLDRVLGPMSLVSTWGANLPYFYEKNGKLIHSGSFKTGRPFLTKLYQMVWATNIRRFFKLELPPRFSSADIRFFMSIVKEIRQEYLKRFPKGSFLVLIYPQRGSPEFIAELEQEKIPYLDYSGAPLANLTATPAYFDLDAHPTAATHEVIGDQIVHDLNLDK
jgi:hypothetical protein